MRDLSWDECQAFVATLRKKVRGGSRSRGTSGDRPSTPNSNESGYDFSLPTEAQWEYACRAGSTTAFANGEITDIQCDDPVLDLIACYCGNTPYPNYEVATKITNDWGLYDMHGNTSEIIWDRYGAYGTGTSESPDIDPTGPATGTSFVFRGGQAYGFARGCRSATRLYSSSPAEGLRLVRNAE